MKKSRFTEEKIFGVLREGIDKLTRGRGPTIITRAASRFIPRRRRPLRIRFESSLALKTPPL